MNGCRHRFCLLLVVFLLTGQVYAQLVHTESTDKRFLRVGNSHYEIVLSATNGAILSLRDSSTGKQVSEGTIGSHLWHADFPNRPGIGGGHFGSFEGSLGSFRHSWDSEKRALSLNYMPASASETHLEASATLAFSESSYIDLQIRIVNRSGSCLRSVALPHCFAFSADEIEESYFPVLPGIRFNKRFFEERRSWRHGHYPRNTVFADFACFRTASGPLGMYSILEEDVTPIVRRQVYPEENNEQYIWRHDYEVVVPNGATWVSPIVRIHVGSTLEAMVDAYREDTGLGSGPSIQKKLGMDYEKVARTLNTKCDVRSLFLEFALRFGDTHGYQALWKGLPGPSLLFICSYPRGGQDESNPDIFPVDPELGSDEEFAAAFRLAHEEGHLVMPYVNPTFWDDKSETALSLRPEEFAVLSEEGVPHREEYSGHGGYAVSPQAPAVQERVERLMREINNKLPIDFIWEDQVGSRYGLDFNPHVPNPIEQAQGWLEHTRRYELLGLMAEHGHDRMVPHHVGFQGNLLLYEKGGDFGDSEWGKGTWEYFPLVPMMARDKIFFYNAPDHYIRSKRQLTWTLAMGQMPSYDIHRSTLNTPWHRTTFLLQNLMLCRFADERILAYEKLGTDFTRTRYETFEVYANGSSEVPRDLGNHTIAPEGFVVQDRIGDSVAGFFTRFNSKALSAGDHCIIALRNGEETAIYHPQGPDTDLTLSLPEKKTGYSAALFVETASNTIPVSFNREENRIRFRLERSIRDEETLRYIVR